VIIQNRMRTFIKLLSQNLLSLSGGKGTPSGKAPLAEAPDAPGSFDPVGKKIGSLPSADYGAGAYKMVGLPNILKKDTSIFNELSSLLLKYARQYSLPSGRESGNLEFLSKKMVKELEDFAKMLQDEVTVAIQNWVDARASGGHTSGGNAKQWEWVRKAIGDFLVGKSDQKYDSAEEREKDKEEKHLKSDKYKRSARKSREGSGQRNAGRGAVVPDDHNK
jgi:hypothetical protein